MHKFYPTTAGIFRQKNGTNQSSETNQGLLICKTRPNTSHLLLVCLVLCFQLGFRSPLSAQTADKVVTATAPAAEGTYQLIFNTRSEDKEIKLSQNELIAIEKLRKDNEVVYARATYSDDIRVRILPRNTINGKGFSPVPLKYYKQEHNYQEYSQIRYVDLQ